MNVTSQLTSMKVGYRIAISMRDLAKTFPPVGLCAFSAMSLAFNGNRPEPAQSTEDRAREFAAHNGLSVTFDFQRSEAIFEQLGARCPLCGGRGQLVRADNFKISRAPMRTEVPVRLASKMRLEQCPTCEGSGQIKNPGDPLARFGDYSDSDAWIASRDFQRLRRSKADPDRAAE